MGKLRALLLLLTVLCIIGGAMLPRVVARVTDRLDADQVVYGQMQSVQLELNVTEQPDPARMLQMLALERNMTTIPVTEAEASMTEEEVYAAVQRQMDEYCDVGIFQWFDVTHRTADPYLAMDPDDPDNFGIIWGVSLSHQESPYHNLFVHLDDATGKILMLDYYTEEYLYPSEEQRYVFEPWTDTYFAQLGLSYNTEYVQSLETDVSETRLDDDTMMVRYTFQEIEFGEIYLEFYVSPNGFYIQFPS